MSLKLKIEYLSLLRSRYFRSRKSEKTRILNELCAITGYSRKYAIRILAIKHIDGPKKSGRRRVYSTRSINHLKKLWVTLGQICSKKMVAALPIWLDFYEGEDFDYEVKEELLAMSASTIDRHLKQYKATMSRRKRTGTKPGKMLKNVIPIKEFDLNVDRPGFVEADTVAHCGNSLSGRHIWSLTFTDVYSGWTDNRAIFGKGSSEVLDAIISIQFKLPYELVSFNTDNGTEFLNRSLINHFAYDKSLKDTLFTRSRAYRKNDNCHVEQKNWTNVREVFGYDRYDDEDLVDEMNMIYKDYHNVLNNFFIPQLKLLKKTRVGAKYVRKYDAPKTPYQRLLESPFLTMGQKEALRRKYKTLNPVMLKKEFEKKLVAFNRKIHESQTAVEIQVVI